MTADTIRPSDENRKIPIQLMHGAQDPVVPEKMGRKAEQALGTMGYQPEYKSYPMEHQVCHEQIADISQWLQRVLS